MKQSLIIRLITLASLLAATSCSMMDKKPNAGTHGSRVRSDIQSNESAPR